MIVLYLIHKLLRLFITDYPCSSIYKKTFTYLLNIHLMNTIKVSKKTKNKLGQTNGLGSIAKLFIRSTDYQ